MTSGVILFAHGARDPEWRAPVDRLATMLAQRLPGACVQVAFLEHMTPGLPEAVAAQAAAGVSPVLIVPVFLARGGHLKQDLPRLAQELQQRFPRTELRVSAPVGEAEPVLAAMASWISGSAAT
jgi:sirohydrochlorin cobaltochelatase